MKIRKANLKDAPELQKLNDEYFGEHRDYTREINDPDTLVFVGEENGNIIGISGLKIHEWNNSAWLLNIFVHPDFRNRGHGQKLVEFAVKEAKKLKLRCLIAEAPSKGNAGKLFTKCEFRKCGHNDRYYNNDASEIAEFYSIDL